MALALGSSGGSAEACSAPQPPHVYFTFLDSLPEEDTQLWVDGAVLLRPRVWQPEGAYGGVFVEGFAEALTVTVTDVATGVTVPGTLQLWPVGGPVGAMAWRPEASLFPNRRYALVAALQQTVSRPAVAVGPTELRRTFTTLGTSAAPLELLGAPEIQLEKYERVECAPGSCVCSGGGGRVSATRARIQVPGIRGGALPGTYWVQLRVTDGTPYHFDAPDQDREHEVLGGPWNADSSGAPFDMDFELPDNDASYVPCFAYRVMDPAGNVQEGAPVCMEQRVDPVGGAGCAAGPAQGASFASLLLVAAGLLRRRSQRDERTVGG